MGSLALQPVEGSPLSCSLRPVLSSVRKPLCLLVAGSLVLDGASISCNNACFYVLAERQTTEQRDSEELQRKLRANLPALSKPVQMEGQEWEQQMREAYLADYQARSSEESAERYACRSILWRRQGLM